MDDSEKPVLRTSEVVSIREAQRGLGALLDRLESGEMAKLVLTRRNGVVAIVLSVGAWEALYD